MPKLSVIVPSIRPQGLLNLYNSIDIEDFEMIVVSPESCGLENLLVRFRWIQSYRSPNACQQQGLQVATGDYITFAADDGVFLPGMLDHAFIYLAFASEGDFPNYKDIIVGKYLEGENPHPDMLKEDYYKFGYHKAYRLKGIPADGLIFNCGIISRKLIMELGGYDAENFDCTTIGHADLSVRASQSNATMILMDDPLFKCSHQQGKTGDHFAVHNAMKKDLKTFKKLYSKPRQTNIDINNWQNTPSVWKERFR